MRIKEGTPVVVDVEKMEEKGERPNDYLEGRIKKFEGIVEEYIDDKYTKNHYRVAPNDEELKKKIGMRTQYCHASAVEPLPLDCEEHSIPVWHDGEERWICPFCYENR